MTLSRPTGYFLEVLTEPAMIVYSKKAIDENAGDLRKVVAPGTGAFMFKDHKAGEKWEFVKNPNYWDPELPYLDGIEMLHTPSLSDRGTAVLTGQADMTWNASVDTWREGENRKNDLTVALIPNPGAHTMHMNNDQEAARRQARAAGDQPGAQSPEHVQGVPGHRSHSSSGAG